MKTFFFYFLPLTVINNSLKNYFTHQLARSYSTINNSVEPIKIYLNHDLQDRELLQDNSNKAGIYRLVNLVNSKSYVGRSTNLHRRFSQYFSINHLMHPSRKNSIISNALLKYGYSQFKLEIIEYCEIKDLVSREQFYIDFLSPEYNILKDAGSSLGLTPSNEGVEKMSQVKKNISEETRYKMSVAHTGKVHSMDARRKISSNAADGTSIFVYSLQRADQDLGLRAPNRYIINYYIFFHPLERLLNI